MSTTWRVSCWTRQYICKGDMIVQWVDCILSSIFTSVLFFKIQDTLFKCLGIKEGLMLFVASCCFSKVSKSQCGNGNAMAGTSCMTWSWWSTPRMWPTTTPATRWPGGARLVSPTMAISTLGHRQVRGRGVDLLWSLGEANCHLLRHYIQVFGLWLTYICLILSN